MNTHLFIPDQQLEGVLDGEVSGGEVELIVAGVGAAQQGKPPKRIKAQVLPKETFVAAATLEMDPSTVGTLSLRTTRSGKYLGALVMVSAGEIINITNANVNGEDLLTRNAGASATGAGVTVRQGQVCEGGDQPQRYFIFFDRDGHRPRDFLTSDVLNIDITNLNATSGTKAIIPIRIMNVVPPNVTFIN